MFNSIVQVIKKQKKFINSIIKKFANIFTKKTTK